MPKNLLHWKMGKNSNIQGNIVHLLYFLHFFFLMIFKIIKRDKHLMFFFPVCSTNHFLVLFFLARPTIFEAEIACW